jgi:hypothetical protein
MKILLMIELIIQVKLKYKVNGWIIMTEGEKRHVSIFEIISSLITYAHNQSVYKKKRIKTNHYILLSTSYCVERRRTKKNFFFLSS